ncbi:MAG: hypothetical protein LBK62_13350, partial [Treponema sp.]|nr:hypothetical protein [Treponema sp.]
PPSSSAPAPRPRAAAPPPPAPEPSGARTAYAGEEAERKSVCVAAPGGVRSYHIVNYTTNSTKILISFERKYKDIEPVSKPA